ncbi:MAG: hypothetical protein Q8K66_03485 [Sediminibacterium sp.]|nr:hypothetical protein [Sediminibacterium sp.]MDP3667054.1 hypothetical protein [Sediminibacterium sp.]
MVEQKIMKTPDEFLKIADEYELDIFTPRSFGKATRMDLGEWMPQLRNLYMNKESKHKKVTVL